MRDNRRLLELWEQLNLSANMLTARLQGYDAEFRRGIADPNYGKEINAPSNYHLVELGRGRWWGPWRTAPPC